MELFRTSDFYIFVSGQFSLWWDRQTGAFIPKTGWDLTDADDPCCLGLCDGIIGKVEQSSVFETSRLLLIKDSLPVGKLHGDNDVYKIKSVVFLPLGPESPDPGLKPCPKHRTLSNSSTISPAATTTTTTKKSPLFDIQIMPKNAALTKTWGTLKSAGNTIRNTTQQAAAMATGGAMSQNRNRRDVKDKERFERQIVDEFYKIFTDTNSFFYSRSTDLTNSLQRFCNLEKQGLVDGRALWRNVDDRFFWNRHMLHDLIQLDSPLCDPWIMPIIQGYIQIEHCQVELPQDLQPLNASDRVHEVFTLCILSRRSRFRAGTRYKRRGVDEEGHCANYVETEQIVAYQSHEVSFVQVRGSVPVYWSQPGYKYRPPPRIDRGEAETRVAFEKHFTNEIHKYGPVCSINLVDQSGKERVIFDAYSNYVLDYNSPFVTYVTFDFHEYCRGMHFENVSILINALADVIKDMNYCWRDRQGHICSQNGVFRVNCIDCLDRTNVVQTAIGKSVMEMQFCKLGLISPEGSMPESIKNTFQLLWANNGDIISKQYAGTNALKGDYTRTGERKFTGIMKDGMNSANRFYKNHFGDAVRQCCLDIMQGAELSDSAVDSLLDFWAGLRTLGHIVASELELLPSDTDEAHRPTFYTPQIALEQEFELANLLYHMSRYYLSRFKDSTRQGTIDLMLGNVVSEDMFNESKQAHPDEEDSVATAEHVKLLIEDCKKMLINQPEMVLGAWGLIDAGPSTGDPNETEMDSILILTKESYFVADYDDQVDKVTKYQQVFLRDVTLLECGVPESGHSLFIKSSAAGRNRFCIRINYTVDGVSGYYHMFRSTHLRFFNNMAVVIKNEDEEIESLKAICESFVVALDVCGLPPIPFQSGKCLDRRKSRVINTAGRHGGIYLDIASLPQMTRNVSESQLLALKSVGTKAISNVTQQFSKLNKIGNTFKKSSKPANPTAGAKEQQPKKPPKPNFSIGDTTNKPGDVSSSTEDSDDDYENSIFQPDNISAEDKNDDTSSSYSNNSRSIEQGLEVTEPFMVTNVVGGEAFLPSVGIVMGGASSSGEPRAAFMEQKHNLILKREDSSQVNEVQLNTIMQSVSLSQAPEIQIDSTDCDPNKRSNPGSKVTLDKKLSHSSGEVDEAESTIAQDLDNVIGKRSNSDYDVALNISQSQSESAIRSRLNNLTSPVATATKDLVFSPFSKLARGVQSFGANLDPRKLGSGVNSRQVVTEKEVEEHRRLQEKWQHSKSRLIAL